MRIITSDTEQTHDETDFKKEGKFCQQYPDSTQYTDIDKLREDWVTECVRAHEHKCKLT